jgi:outer membrane protein assembly factor BamB
LRPLESLTTLRALSLDFNPVIEIAPLASLKELRLLSIDAATYAAPRAAHWQPDVFDVLSNPSLPLSATSDYFGESLARVGDGFLVGVPFDTDDDGLAAGSVRLYSGSGELLHTLHSPNPVDSGQFGSALAAGDGRVLIAESRAGFNYARAHLFDAVTGQLVNTFPIDFFESLSSVAIAAGDLFLAVRFGSSSYVEWYDGKTFQPRGTLSVAGSTADFGSEMAGTDRAVFFQNEYRKLLFVGDKGADKVHIFDAATGKHLDSWINPNPTAAKSYGTSIAVSGNLVVIGAPENLVAGQAARGMAYVYDAATGQLLRSISNPHPAAAFNNFGSLVDSSGTIVMIGAPQGRAYLYDALGAAADPALRLIESPNMSFARAIALVGNRALIGNYNPEGDGSANRGGVYVFEALELSDISPLSNLRHLRWLSLADNQIADVSVLAELTSLESLWLPNNRVQSIDALLGQQIIDNFDAGYTEPAAGWAGSENVGAFEEDYRILPEQLGVC